MIACEEEIECIEGEWREQAVYLSEPYRQAEADVRRIMKKIKYARCRRARPRWSCPNELWRLALFPKEDTAESERYTRSGLGFRREPVTAELVKQKKSESVFFLVLILGMYREHLEI